MKDYMYAYLYDKGGTHIDRIRTFEKQYKVNDKIERTTYEGHFTYNILNIEELEFTNEPKAKYQKLIVEAPVYTKTWCDHNWTMYRHETKLEPDRFCSKCSKIESFNFGKAKWE